jgi:hypothetical protein
MAHAKESSPHKGTPSAVDNTEKTYGIISGIFLPGLIILILLLVIPFTCKKCGNGGSNDETHGGEFYFTNAQTGARISRMMSMDSLDRLNQHIEFDNQDETRSLTFFSKGPIDTYWPSCNEPGKWIHRYYCGKGVFNWEGLDYCTGIIRVFKSDDDDCD